MVKCQNTKVSKCLNRWTSTVWIIKTIYSVSPKGLKCFSYKVLKPLNIKESEYNNKLRSPSKINQKNKDYEVSIAFVERSQ